MSPAYLEPTIRRAGLLTASGSMDVRDLQYHTSRGRPVVCLIRHEDSGHYVVCSGVERGRVWLHDPLSGERSVRAGEWLNVWSDRDRGTEYRQFGISVWRV